MAQTNINVLILGKTGSGKSALINYLYGEEVLKEGIGKPVTAKGDFKSLRVPSPLKPDVTITIYDSWGLEANRAEEWERLMREKLTATLSYADMITAWCIACLMNTGSKILI